MALAVIFCYQPVVYAEILLEDTVWEGEVQVEDDVVVPAGVTLTVQRDTVVTVVPSESTKTDPEYLSPLTEITIRGTLKVEGEPAHPVIFRRQQTDRLEEPWAGIIIDGGRADIRAGVIREADAGIWILRGRLDIEETTLTANRYGLVAHGKATDIAINTSSITGNDFGILTFDGLRVNPIASEVAGNSKSDIFSPPAYEYQLQRKDYSFASESSPREIGDEVLMGDVLWQGHIVIDGRVRVPPDSRLIVLPGTIVEFRKKDTNGDGIGENGLMLQGVLIAKGTPENPILFRSAEKERRPGDWDALNIINSDGVRNIIEYCQFEDAYRGLHFHFSNVIIQHSVFLHNYRAVQFQESTVEIQGSQFYENTSAVQARDSEIVLADNQLVDNVFGANFLRAHLTIHDNEIGFNDDFGLKIREGYPTVEHNVLHKNRHGLMLSDTSFGRVAGNLLVDNGENGLSVRTGANLEVTDNFIQGNGLSGISLRDTVAVIRDNHITKNGERGIGVISFQGPITGNTIMDNGLYAIAAEDDGDVTAPYNWYGRTDIEEVIFDRNDDQSRGVVQFIPIAGQAPLFAWPLAQVPLDLNWAGRIRVSGEVRVPSSVRLVIEPGTRVLFGRGAGIYAQGILFAEGTPEHRITFSAAEDQEPGSWGEVQVEHAAGSIFANCDFQYATWGLHSHFTPLPVLGCTFRNNKGGMRFRSGPVEIRNSLFSDNTIGIRAYLGIAQISNNTVTGNRKGIFVREKGGGLTITGNNIHDNIDYNIWVGDFNKEDIKAPGNFWGTDDPVSTFFDARREPGIGTIHYEPALKEPVAIRFSHEADEKQNAIQ